MTKKNEFSDIVADVDKKFKEIEKRNEKISELRKKSPSVKKIEINKHVEKMKQDKKMMEFRIKEKLTYAVIAFFLGHAMLIPLYLKFPDLFLGMFVVASISLGVICLAVIEYT